MASRCSEPSRGRFGVKATVTIRAWLGHVSLDTTHIYAEVDLEMKAKALASVDITDLPAAARLRSPSPSLMEFMRRL